MPTRDGRLSPIPPPGTLRFRLVRRFIELNTVQVRSERRSVRAREANDDERLRLWPRLVEMYPEFDVYQTRTSRKIPVVILNPAE